ncbi:hypothetical protein Glove_86g217 [Diversispora epigaea]|uniref:Uncharacterized protein n=1 Tax=Diversispora epigaea TaxID=1348612 RepID=A0A397JA27_9GLOM|nr:hypothetical protein Glove_86g217 [Diversispora epigaea]
MKLAEGGGSKEQNKLGKYYRYDIGTIKDEEKAFQWYLKSTNNLKAEGEDCKGQNKLGYCYLLGTGTAKDEEEIFQWYLKFSRRGNHLILKNIINMELDP